MQHVEAGLVGGKPRAHLLHATEGPDCYAAVRLAAPRTAPVLQPEQFLGRFLDEHLDGILVAEPVAAGDSVIGVFVEGVVGTNNAGGAALGGDGVTPHRIDLGDDRDAESRVGFRNGDGRTQSCSTATYQHNVVRRSHRQTRARIRDQPQTGDANRTGRCGQDSNRGFADDFFSPASRGPSCSPLPRFGGEGGRRDSRPPLAGLKTSYYFSPSSSLIGPFTASA